MDREEAKGLLLKGMLIVNAFMAPIAALGLYMALLGRREGDTALLAAGAVLAVLSPVLGYLAALPLIKRIAPRGEHGG